MELSEVGKNYRKVCEAIEDVCSRNGRAPGSVTLVAVSKTKPPEMVMELYKLGHRDFGENYVQELCAKAQWFLDRGITDIRWHFIGHLQSNKAKALVDYVSVVQTVDRFEIAKALSDRWVAKHPNRKLPVFIEVNIDAESSKAGVLPGEVNDLVEKVKKLPALDVRGLMIIPAIGQRESFLKASQLSDGLKGGRLPELSMGMSEDFVSAIEAGSTCVRVGSKIFGSRAPVK